MTKEDLIESLSILEDKFMDLFAWIDDEDARDKLEKLLDELADIRGLIISENIIEKGDEMIEKDIR